jgi:hypothetical protein
VGEQSVDEKKKIGIHSWPNGWVAIGRKEWMNIRVKKFKGGRLYGINEWMDEWMNEWMDG